MMGKCGLACVEKCICELPILNTKNVLNITVNSFTIINIQSLVVDKAQNDIHLITKIFFKRVVDNVCDLPVIVYCMG